MAAANHYETLGVKRGTTVAEIRRAYRELAKRYHPDASKAAGSEKKFAEIARAYEVLSDKDQRRAYDASLDRGHEGRGANGSAVRSETAHFTWTNIAAEQSQQKTGTPTELDEMYDTFFGRSVGPNEARMKKRQPKAG